MEIVTVKQENIGLLKDFIASLGEAEKSFRYFNSRSPDVISNHLTTIIFVNEMKQPVAYGHLDKEQDNVWLGICVLPEYYNKGYGKKMMEQLIGTGQNLGLSSVLLSVDKDNPVAIQLYEKFNFQLTEETASYFKYKLDIPC
jgi:RimJ/RimL family protein N-acetyltransferase